MPKAKPILDFKDKEDKRYIFSKENFNKHKVYHPEFLDTDFVNKVIKEAVCKPDFIYPAYKQINRYCYYLYEYNIGADKWYTKVVVEKMKWVYVIITAFRLNKIQEARYSNKPCNRP